MALHVVSLESLTLWDVMKVESRLTFISQSTIFEPFTACLVGVKKDAVHANPQNALLREAEPVEQQRQRWNQVVKISSLTPLSLSPFLIVFPAFFLAPIHLQDLS